jgi:hypothetical protein
MLLLRKIMGISISLMPLLYCWRTWQDHECSNRQEQPDPDKGRALKTTGCAACAQLPEAFNSRSFQQTSQLPAPRNPETLGTDTPT